MAVSYNKLWNLVRQNKMKKGDLAKAAQITSRSMSKLNHDEPVQMEVMIRLCKVFHCDIRMEIRNNPYFHEIKFRINSSDIILETEGDVGGGIGGAVLAGVLQGAGINTRGAQADTPGNFSERRRYAECAAICQKIEQAVEDGKRGAQPAAVIPAAPVQEAPKPKFCPNCGAPYEGGKFCQNCGSRI